MYKIKLTNEEIDEFIILHRSYRKDQRKADRIKAILLLDDGYDEKEVAKILLLDEDTITAYKKRFLGRKNSSDWLNDYQIYYEGKLNDVQELMVKKFVRDNIVTNSAIVKQYILDKLGIKYTKSGTIDLMHRINLVYKRSKSIPSNFDPVKQAEFKEWYEDFEKNITAKEAIVFADAVHPQHNTKICNVWVEKGKDKEIKTNSGRTRININGAYNPHTTDVIARQDDTINSESMLKLFQDVEKFYPEKETIYFIADNARYNKSKMVFEYLKTSRIKIIFLPPYSPNLNLIERLWKLLRKLKINTTFHQSSKDFKDAVMGFFENINLYKKEIKQSVGTKMHLLRAV
jgi:transposase